MGVISWIRNLSVVLLCKFTMKMTFYFLGCISQTPDQLQSVSHAKSAFVQDALEDVYLSGASAAPSWYWDKHVLKSFSKVCCSPELQQSCGSVWEKETTPCYLLLLDHSLLICSCLYFLMDCFPSTPMKCLRTLWRCGESGDSGRRRGAGELCPGGIVGLPLTQIPAPLNPFQALQCK